MKHLLLILSTLFAFNGFACLNESGTNLEGESHIIDKGIAYLEVNNLKNDITNNVIAAGGSLDSPSESNVDAVEEISEGTGQQVNEVAELELDEKPKKKKKIIKGMIYYLGGGFVLLLIGMIFFIRKKPKTS